MMKDDNLTKQNQEVSTILRVERSDLIEQMNKPSCPLTIKEKQKLVTYIKNTRKKIPVVLLAVKEL
ncbi:MAG: hypothetical protein V3V00_14210 [Saprospiraceae bacterium]